MATKFTISDSESEPSEEVEDSDQSPVWQDHNITPGHAHITPEPRMTASGRVRLNSESNVSTVSRDEELQARGEGEDGEGAPFRGRSQSAPPALWAAKKYGRRLRRMSDEFDSWLDKGECRSTAKPIRHSKSWWSYLFSHQETEVESNHHENHGHRTE
ncbi:BCL2 associated agonist of cell death b [Diretmus argenteus]